MNTDEEMGESWLAMKREMSIDKYAKRNGLRRDEVQCVIHRASGKAFVQWVGAIPDGIVYRGAVMTSDPAPRRSPTPRPQDVDAKKSSLRCVVRELLVDDKACPTRTRRLRNKLARLVVYLVPDKPDRVR